MVEEAAPSWVLMWVLKVFVSDISKEKLLWPACPEGGERVLVMQSPPIREPEEQVMQP